eukprot:scaffold2872_cov112-Isochrysis_galbana.AAC.4
MEAYSSKSRIWSVRAFCTGKYGSCAGVRRCALRKLAKPKAFRCSRCEAALPPIVDQNTVERQLLISAAEMGGAAYMLVAGCLTTIFKTVGDDLRGNQESFRAIALKAALRQGA